ncbi:hypothetical protein STEG23_025862, partial [Scotinomys teguina]
PHEMVPPWLRLPREKKPISRTACKCTVKSRNAIVQASPIHGQPPSDAVASNPCY